MEKHAQLIGLLWIIYGALSLLGGAILVFILLAVSYIPDIGDVAPQILRIIGLAVGSIFFFIGIPKIIGGVGVIQHQEWGRILVLILSFFALLNFPLGTALGIYSLIFLLKPEMVALFQSKK